MEDTSKDWKERKILNKIGEEPWKNPRNKRVVDKSQKRKKSLLRKKKHNFFKKGGKEAFEKLYRSKENEAWNWISKEERFKGRKGGIEMEEENKKSSKRAASVDVDGRHGRRALRTRMHTIVS